MSVIVYEVEVEGGGFGEMLEVTPHYSLLYLLLQLTSDVSGGPGFVMR